LILQAVFAHYEALKNGTEVQATHSRPYRDYIDWLQKQDFLAAKNYWQTQLSGFTAPTSLGVDRYNNEILDAYAEHELIFSIEQTQQLQDFVKQQHITLNTLVQGVWALLLSRYSGEQDILFGTTVSGRPAELSGVEFMVGLFINSLPMRVQIPTEIDVATWLKTLFEQNLELRRYEYTPLVQIQGWSDIPRGLPLFESLLVFENYPIDAALAGANSGSLQRGELVVENITTQDYTSYPLTISAFPSTQFKLAITYDVQRFDSVSILRMLGHLQTLMNVIVQQPTAKLCELPLLTIAEQQQLVAWNAAATADYALPAGIHQLFEQQVEKTPNALAIVFGNESLDYATLNQQANQVAHYLLSLGVHADDRVAICMERSINMIVAVLGILKAGGAYLPLDPNYPSERLAYMLNDAAPVALLTQSSLQNHLPNNTIPQLLLDTEQDLLAKQTVSNPNIAIQPHHLAYIIYTSGSTGHPKGVMIAHGGVCNMATDLRIRYQLCETDRNLQFASLAFDMSVEEIFGALISGAALVLRTDAWLTGASEFWALCQQYGITALNLPTLFWQQLSEEEQVAIPSTVRLIAIGGDAVNSRALIHWFERKGHHPQLFNAYGPTEATVNAAIHTLTTESLSWQSIGRPTANTQIYILDTHLQTVPIGITGEIYIGGAGVARGYLNRDDLTAERFSQHSDYGRIYKAGDLGRWLADGSIEYLGRNDFQVKIRGFRIELGEIETYLLACQGVRDAVVLAREDKAGNKRLVAYLIAQDGVDLSTETLRVELANHLADYMIPNEYVVLPEFPLTSNGKLNRNALPAPDFSVSQQHYIAPRTDTEKTLAALWCEMLEMEQVGLQDNFFALGGHSLIATQLISRLCKIFAITMPIKTLFEAATLEKLAEQVELALWVNSQTKTAQDDSIEFEEIEL